MVHSKPSVLQNLVFGLKAVPTGSRWMTFIYWYCSEFRVAFGRSVVLRYRYELEGVCRD
jgi:hypothetical protein